MAVRARSLEVAKTGSRQLLHTSFPLASKLGTTGRALLKQLKQLKQYGRSARSFSEHHGQRISHAIVMTDALNICEGTTKLKKRLLMQSRAD